MGQLKIRFSEQIDTPGCGGGEEGAGQGGGGEVQVQEQEPLDGRTDCRAVG